jgi:hypothetical protein
MLTNVFLVWTISCFFENVLKGEAKSGVEENLLVFIVG